MVDGVNVGHLALGSQTVQHTLRGIEIFDELHRFEGKKFTSIETAAALLAALGNPQDATRSVHIAGTNGKGTTAAILSAILHAAGSTVGQTVSPHLAEVNERCLINGSPDPIECFSRAVEAVIEVSEKLQIQPGYFVLGMAASFYEFARLALDWSVVEVGLGGSSDATNVISRPEATVVTTISFDHTELLGCTLGEIAAHKAGIAKSGVPMFVGAVPREARDVIVRRCKEVGAPVELYGEDFGYDEEAGEVWLPGSRVPFRRVDLPLEGSFQTRNAVLAIRTAHALGVGVEAISAGIRRVRWPGRLEWSADRRVLLDVAHNPEGAEVLVDYVERFLPEAAGSSSATPAVRFVISIVDRKDWRTMLDRFRAGRDALSRRGIECSFTFTHSGNTSAVDPVVLAAHFGSGEAVSDPERALTDAMSRGGVVVITGSVFLVGRLRSLVTDQPVRSIA